MGKSHAYLLLGRLGRRLRNGERRVDGADGVAIQPTRLDAFEFINIAAWGVQRRVRSASRGGGAAIAP